MSRRNLCVFLLMEVDPIDVSNLAGKNVLILGQSFHWAALMLAISLTKLTDSN